MSHFEPHLNPRPLPPDDSWPVAWLELAQGHWTEADYLAWDAGRVVDFENGFVEVHTMPTKGHQRLVQAIYRSLDQFVAARALGEVFVAPLPVRLWENKFREPDILFIARSRGEYRGYPDGVDLVIEVVSEDPGSRLRDLETKPAEYARARVPEYWIVDPLETKIVVGVLADEAYRFTEYRSHELARSTCLPGWQLNVREWLSASD